MDDLSIGIDQKFHVIHKAKHKTAKLCVQVVVTDGNESRARLLVEDLLHISEIDHKRINRVEDVFQVGDTVGIGPFELVVEPHDGPAPGSRALDDRDRTRISGEVLRPRRDEP